MAAPAYLKPEPRKPTMDRAPLPPPFPVGTTIRYTGSSEMSLLSQGESVPVIYPGIVVTVCRTEKGRRGTLNAIPFDDDDGDPALDRTQDGFSVYQVEVPGQKPFGRIIWPKDAHDWERV